MHPFKTFEVFPDYIRIDNHTLERPSYISYEQWIEVWDFEKERGMTKEIESLYIELNDKDDEISDLEGRLEDG